MTVKLPPKVVRPVPVVIAVLLVVLRFRAVGESIVILPVDVEPIFNDCRFVVPSVPSPVT